MTTTLTMKKDTRMMSRLSALLVIGALLSTTACSNMNQTEQRVLSGGAIGATVGTIGTLATGGCVACGAAIGGAVGAGSGYVYDQLKK